MSINWSFERLYHTILNVREINESIAFYEMLGFKVISDRRETIWPKGSGKAFAITPDTRGRAVLMVLPNDADGPMLDLIEWVVPKQSFPAHDPNVVPRILAFRVKNVRAAYEDLKAKGVKFTTEELMVTPETGVIGACCCFDPSGNIVEMIELEPGLRHSRIKEAYTPSGKP